LLAAVFGKSIHHAARITDGRRLHASLQKEISKMRLHIRRDQQEVKGMLGGSRRMSFTLRYKMELTEEESEVVRRYRLEYYPLTWRTIQGTRTADDTIGNMVEGRSQTVTDVTTLLANEKIVKDACDALPALFNVVRTFGGREIVDYPRT
jgi:hypothetical protein